MPHRSESSEPVGDRQPVGRAEDKRDRRCTNNLSTRAGVYEHRSLVRIWQESDANLIAQRQRMYGHIGSSVLSHCESVRTEIRNFLSCHSSHILGEPT